MFGEAVALPAGTLARLAWFAQGFGLRFSCHEPAGSCKWKERNVLNFVVSGLAADLQFLPASADFVRHFLHMSAVDKRQPPLSSNSTTSLTIPAGAQNR